jgi:hypothetical protein
MTNLRAETGTGIASTPTHWLGWAAFLGASWTWCIGMFLPVLLVRDYGLWGWVVFAVPNVLGAAAMGWLIRSPEGSREITSAHREACRLFSAVTIAFHLYFALAVVAPLTESVLHRSHSMDLALACFVAGGTLMYVYMTRWRDGDRTLAIVALSISAVAMVYTSIEIHSIAVTTPERMLPLKTDWCIDLLWLAPACVLGFMACPYLDLTFHRARQNSAAPRASFGVGFGVLFLAMIVFSLIYSRAFAVKGITSWIAILLFVHMAVQSTFTIAAHARELRSAGPRAGAVATVLTLAAWGAYWSLPDSELIHRMRAGEIIYRGFMGFYGLVFPAYVWLVMLPARGMHRSAPPTRWNLVVYAIVVVLAGPMFFMGFVWQEMIWLAPGVGIVLLARLLVRPADSNRRGGFEVIPQQNSAPI